MPISSISRNTLAPVIEVQDANGNVLVPARVDIRESVEVTDVRQLPHTQGDTWGTIGHRHLGDARHWWVIAELSGVIDPFTELTAAKSLKIPTVDAFYFDVLNQE